MVILFSELPRPKNLCSSIDGLLPGSTVMHYLWYFFNKRSTLKDSHSQVWSHARNLYGK